MRITEEQYADLYQRTHGALPLKGKVGRTERPYERPHKYGAQAVILDGHRFPSKWEAQCYVDLKWQALAGLITEPLLQVPFWLGTHYGRHRVYRADFVFVERKSETLVVADAKGAVTPEYARKKCVFEDLYGMRIRELRESEKNMKKGSTRGG